MYSTIRTASLTLAVGVSTVSIASGQSMLMDVMIRHGVQVPGGSYERAFDDRMRPSTPVNPGTFATPLAMLTSATGGERIEAAFAFGVLAGHWGHAASPQERAAAGQSLVSMIVSADRRSRVAGARVAGRIFAAPWGPDASWPVLPAGLIDGLFAMLNQDSEIDQLAAMDALGLTRQTDAVASLVERYRFYRNSNKRALAGGALEALARIGVQSSVVLVKELGGDRWADGRDATALAVAFARERLLHDGSIGLIQQALNDKSRHAQARGYLIELRALAP